MAEIIKISSPGTLKSNVQNLNRQIAPDALFDLVNPLAALKPKPQVESEQKGMTQQGLLQDLNKSILEPLVTPTGVQSGKLRELLLLAQLFEVSWGKLSPEAVDKIFVSPGELLGELTKLDKQSTVFRGDIFDSLRMLAGVKGQPQLTEAIANILKFFDCYVNQEYSLKTIAAQGENLVKQLPRKAEADVEALTQLTQRLSALVETVTEPPRVAPGQAAFFFPEVAQSEKPPVMNNPAMPLEEGLPLMGDEGVTAELPEEAEELEQKVRLEQREQLKPKVSEALQKELQAFLKEEYLPELAKLVKQYPASSWVRNSVMELIHHVVRYDKAEMANLEDAAFRLGEVLKPLTSINDQGVEELKNLLIQTAVEAQNKEAAGSDLADLLEVALEKGSPEKVSRVANTLLTYMVQNESPVLPFVYFMIPIRFMDENVYGEFLIDKECKKKRGDAKEATNIFFTIQSDELGNFEVDLLSKDRYIDLEVKCPAALTDALKEGKGALRDIIEDQGYRLSNYKVDVCREGKSILERFPELRERQVGIDVKI